MMDYDKIQIILRIITYFWSDEDESSAKRDQVQNPSLTQRGGDWVEIKFRLKNGLWGQRENIQVNAE